MSKDDFRNISLEKLAALCAVIVLLCGAVSGAGVALYQIQELKTAQSEYEKAKSTDHELLVRIEERVKATDERVKSILERLEPKRQTQIADNK